MKKKANKNKKSYEMKKQQKFKFEFSLRNFFSENFKCHASARGSIKANFPSGKFK